MIKVVLKVDITKSVIVRYNNNVLMTTIIAWWQHNCSIPTHYCDCPKPGNIFPMPYVFNGSRKEVIARGFFTRCLYLGTNVMEQRRFWRIDHWKWKTSTFWIYKDNKRAHWQSAINWTSVLLVWKINDR
jgi:hypothetical protein